MTRYDKSFFDRLEEGSEQSAEVIVPVILDLLRPESVLDVGCGRGIWLSAFLRNGVRDVLGVDGDYVSPEDLVVPQENFVAADLVERLDLKRTFDLVVSLEVAEHLAEDHAARFVKSLVRHSSSVLFSAAIPHQGGTQHANEQWPSYWAELFAHHGYRVRDLIRRVVWSHESVQPWYAQNILLFHSDDEAVRLPSPERTSLVSLDVVHPRRYLEVVEAGRETERCLWHARARLVEFELAATVGDEVEVILLDDWRLSISTEARCRRVLGDRGADEDSVARGSTAEQAIDGLRAEGVQYLVQTWLAFWWNDLYPDFQLYLERESKCLLSTESCRIYQFSP